MNNDLGTEGDDLSEVLGFARNHHDRPKIMDVAKEFIFAKKKTLELIEKIKNKKFALTLNNHELNTAMELSMKQLSESLDVELPSWQAMLFEAIDDLRNGDNGDTIIIVNPFERNPIKGPAKSFVGRALFKGVGSAVGDLENNTVGIEVNSLLLKDGGAFDEHKFQEEFLVSLLEVQFSKFYNSNIRPQNNVTPMKFLSRGEVKNLYRVGYRFGGDHRRAGVLASQTIIY
ncbi:MAG: hypothetical protein WCT22_04075 [Patescibacteria group bacterium]